MRLWVIATFVALLGCSANRFAMTEDPAPTPALFIGSFAYDGHAFGDKWRPRKITLDFRRIDLTTQRYVKGGEEFQVVRTFDGGDTKVRKLDVYHLRPGLYGAYRATIDWDPALQLPPLVQNTPDIDIDIARHALQIEDPLVSFEVRPGAVTYGGEAVIYIDQQHGEMVIQPARIEIYYDEAAARRLLEPELASDRLLTYVPIR